VRIDMSAWLLTEREISMALVSRFRAGVPVRLIGDRVSIFESDPLTRREFYWLASQGIPIRLRSNPDWHPEINHWKATIFVGQNTVSFGSANYTPFELRPVVPGVDYKDESVMFSDDPSIVNAFKTKFDRMWNDTTPEPGSRIVNPPFMKNWTEACAIERMCADYAVQYPNAAPMYINTARLEPDYSLPPEMVWEQGAAFNNRLIQEINRESARIDLIAYRLTVDSVASALIAKHRAGVRVRVIIEPSQYTTTLWPEYWLTHANVDRLWAAGVPIRQRAHTGLTHMKVLVTSSVATNASSNIAPSWQRDHNYFIPASTKPAAYRAFRDRFEAMWNDSAAFTGFTPLPPYPPTLATPTAGAAAPIRPQLVWNRTPFAVGYGVYIGTSPSSMALAADIPAVLTPTPPATYSWTPPVNLQTETIYYWRVVAYTYANLSAASETGSFTTSGGATVAPPPPPPAPTNVPTTARLWWRHYGSGSLGVWRMNNDTLLQATGIPEPEVADLDWHVAGVGDFNRDGHADLLWQHRSQWLLAVWLMRDSTYLGPGRLSVSTISDLNWEVRAVTDLNRDAHVDLVWQHRANGRLVVWYMNDLTVVATRSLSPGQVADTNWKVVGAGDINRDGYPDLVWQHQASRLTTVWLMRGATSIGSSILSPNIVEDKQWAVVAVVDLNQDGHSDLLWRHLSNGSIVVWYLNSNSLVLARTLSASPVTDLSWRVVGAR
jgi:hypothetical protein